MKKTLPILLTVFVLTAAGWFIWNKMNQQKDLMAAKDQSWETYHKTSDDKVMRRPATQAELEKIGAESSVKEEEEREPLKRKWLGPKKAEALETQKDKEWKTKLAKELLRIHEPTTKVLIKQVGSFVKEVANKPVYMEHVVVSYIMENGKRTSFNAFVNTETHQIIRSWNRTILEDKPGSKPTVIPSGTL